jgi:exosome complex RNA-binding protein Csl4
VKVRKERKRVFHEVTGFENSDAVFRVHGVKKVHGKPEKSSRDQMAAYHVQRISDETKVRKLAFCYIHGILKSRYTF